MTKFVIDTLPLIGHTVNPTITIETDLPLDISPVKADAIQMQLVLSSILSNSSEAIQGKGRIIISCREVKAGEIEDRGLAESIIPERYVRLTIKDNGKGMDKEARDKIFEPFFTTKFQGRGLGMAAVYGIIKNHDGWIDVESEPEEGTSVHIYLPTTRDKVERVSVNAKEKLSMLKGAGTVLLIEDDEMVMDVSQTLLERMGYEVISASTGKEALEKNRHYKGQVDLALLDIKLPDMKAINIYTKLKSARPELKVIVYSGFSQEGSARELIDAGADAFIQKPFSVRTLSKTIDEILKK
jgi:CheY-like chemotaxis protein